MDKQVVDKQRVVDFGEVYTNPREVEAMLDLVKDQTERIDARFLEPACGTGNFLDAILRRKLAVIHARYRKSQLEYEQYLVVAVASLYGIEIQEGNVHACRARLLNTADEAYRAAFPRTAKAACRQVIWFILEHNIVQGDALSMKTAPGDPIVLSEWSMINGKIKRREFAYHMLSRHNAPAQQSLFEPAHTRQKSDEGEDAFTVKPIRDFPLVPFLRLADARAT